MDKKDDIVLLRSRLLQNGYMPIPVQTAKPGYIKTGKHPLQVGWPERARIRKLEECRIWTEEIEPDQMNTGIMCDGLRAIDIDIDDQNTRDDVVKLMEKILGATDFIRCRKKTPRILALYRAAVGEPGKRQVGSSEAGKLVEVLGRGQFFVAFGDHHSGAAIEWLEISPADTEIEKVPPVSEEKIEEFLIKVGETLGCPFKKKTESAYDPVLFKTYDKMGASHHDIIACLDVIGNDFDSYDDWIKIGAAIYNSGGDFGLFDLWSSLHRSYRGRNTQTQWTKFSGMPTIGFGTLVWMAKQVDPEFMTPSFREKIFADPSVIVDDRRGQPAEGNAATKRNKFSLSKCVSNYGEVPPAQWQVQNLITRKSTAMLYAPSNTGKSYILIDLACSTAFDTGSFAGNKIFSEGGKVLYIAAEDPDGIRRRIYDWGKCHNVDVNPEEQKLLVFPSPINVLDVGANGEIHELIDELKGKKFEFIIFDTLSQCSIDIQNPNDDGEARRICAAFNMIRDQLNTTIIFAHHTGKDVSKGAAGSKGYVNNVDCVIAASRNGEVIKLDVEKQRNAAKRVVKLFTEEVEILNSGGNTSTTVKISALPDAKEVEEAHNRPRKLIELLSKESVDTKWKVSEAVRKLGMPKGGSSDKSLIKQFQTAGDVEFNGWKLGLIEEGRSKLFSIKKCKGDEGDTI